MEGNIADMGQFIGAGLACVGMGGAGIGVGHRRGQLPVRRAAQPGRRRRADRDAVHRHRLRRSARHLLVPGRAAADVRGLIADGEPLAAGRDGPHRTE